MTTSPAVRRPRRPAPVRLVGVVAAGVLAAAIALAGAAPAGADVGELTTPIGSGYAEYPTGAGVVPEGCEAQGEQLLVGEQFSVNDGEPAATLRVLDPRVGDTVALTWESLAAGCDSALVTLSVKRATTLAFDPTANLAGAHSVSCSTTAGPCEALGNRLELTLLGVDGPCFELTAHLGPPLAVLGPAGAYYNALNRRFNVEISAKRGGAAPCERPCATDPSLLETSPGCSTLPSRGVVVNPLPAGELAAAAAPVAPSEVAEVAGVAVEAAEAPVDPAEAAEAGLAVAAPAPPAAAPAPVAKPISAAAPTAAAASAGAAAAGASRAGLALSGAGHVTPLTLAAAGLLAAGAGLLGAARRCRVLPAAEQAPGAGAAGRGPAIR